MKKHFVAFLLTLFVFFFYYLFQLLNQESHPLNHNEYSVRIYQLDVNNSWVPFQKDKNLSVVDSKRKKSIKSVLIFKKEGEVSLNFSFTNKEKTSEILYQIYHNGDRVDTFTLNKGKEHKKSFFVSCNDRIELLVEAYGVNPYWGTLKSSFYFFSLSLEEKLIPILWGTLFLFLFYRGYVYLFFLSYFSFLLTLISEQLNFSFLNVKILFSYTFFFFFWSFFLVLIYQLGSFFKRFKIASLLLSLFSLSFILVPLLFMLYVLNFDHVLSKESLYAIFQSNSHESMEYIKKFVDFKYMLLFVVVNVFFLWLVYRQERAEYKKIESSMVVFLMLIFSIIGYFQLTEYRLKNFIFENINEYNKELLLFKKVQAQRAAGVIEFYAKKEEQGETYVVVIGESLNKNHMGIYGYDRETTPNLSAMRDDLILYQNAYSNHTHTVPVLSLALTEANQYNKKDYFNSPSIVEVLNKANIDTYWLTNQTLYGEWDNKVSVIATEAKNITALNHAIGVHVVTEQYDEALVEKLKPILQEKSKKNRVVFVHLMGSHSLYASRYPKDKYSIYKEKIKVSQKGIKIKNSQELNCYDNTVYYNDYVVSSLLKLLQKQEGVSAFLYFSDHSEDIERDVGHSWEKFSYEMTEIPFVGWFSPSYQKKYSMAYNNFKKNQYKLFSNDMVYDTLIGLFGIKTEHYEKVYDLSAKEYLLTEEKALVLHGKKKYVTPENHCYEKRKNKSY